MNWQHIYFVLLGLAACAGLVSWQRLPNGFRVITLLLIYTLAHEITVNYFKNETNFIRYALYASVSTFGYGLFFALTLSTSRHKQILLKIILPFVLAAMLVATYFTVSFPSQLVVIAQIIIISLSLLVLLDQINKNFHTNLWKSRTFLLTVLIFLYHGLTMIYLGAINYLMVEKSEFDILSHLHRGISIVYYSAIGYLLLRFITHSKGAIQ
jgi:hypothetical protein